MIAPESLMVIAMSRSDDPPGADVFLPLLSQRLTPSWSVATWFLTPGLGGPADDWIEAGVFELSADQVIRSYAKNIRLSLSHVAVYPTAPTVTPRACSNAPSTMLPAELAAQHIETIWLDRVMPQKPPRKTVRPSLRRCRLQEAKEGAASSEQHTSRGDVPHR
jgi:hypothetical protein